MPGQARIFGGGLASHPIERHGELLCQPQQFLCGVCIKDYLRTSVNKYVAESETLTRLIYKSQ